MDWTTIITALITAILTGGGVSAWFESRIKKTAIEAETAIKRREIDIDAWCKLIETQSTRIDTLIMRVATLERELEARDTRIDDLEEEIDDLRQMMRDKGITPPPRRRPARKSEQ